MVTSNCVLVAWGEILLPWVCRYYLELISDEDLT